MSHDTWIHRIGRVAVVKPLARTAVTPNQLTTARLVTGMLAAIAVGIGEPAWRDAGAGVFVLSVVLDRADGDLARITGRASAAGHRYDLIADSVANAMIMIGLGIGLRDGGFGLLAVPMGLVAGVAVAAVLRLTLRLEAADGARAGELPGLWGFDADDAILVIPVAIWFDQAEIVLAAAAIAAPVFAAVFWWRSRRRLGPSSRRGGA